ncbi:MAG TPA: molybdenum ABC transporter ATP-binding protein [Myxococcota bacterium]|jgi:molybdate transport system ATP-binding protein
MLSVRLQTTRGAFSLDVAFEVQTPAVVALIGASGSGKTTTLDALAGLLAPAAGRIAVGDSVLFDAGAIDVPAERRRIGYVFQDSRLFPHRSVRGNLLYGERRAPPGARDFALDGVAQLLGLGALLGRRPHQLSGGERKRVAIGRALLSQPRLLLLDEPLASLDPARREELLPYLERLRDGLRIPIVYVSHQLDEVYRLATQVVLLANGRVAAQGDLGAVSRHPALRELLGPEAACVVVAGEVRGAHGGLARVRVGDGELALYLGEAQPRERVLLLVRARDVILSAEEPRGLAQPNVLVGAITALAAETESARLAEVDAGGVRLLARVSAERADALRLTVGSRVWLIVNDASRYAGGPSA